jgi:hypothetical protein
VEGLVFEVTLRTIACSDVASLACNWSPLKPRSTRMSIMLRKRRLDGARPAVRMSLYTSSALLTSRSLMCALMTMP